VRIRGGFAAARKGFASGGRAGSSFRREQGEARGEGAKSVREVAAELYRAHRRVEELKTALEAPGLDAKKELELREGLRRAEADRSRLRAMLEGAKAG